MPTVQLLPDFVSWPWLMSMRTQVLGDPSECRVFKSPLYTCLEMNDPIATGIRSGSHDVNRVHISRVARKTYTVCRGTPRPFVGAAVRICWPAPRYRLARTAPLCNTCINLFSPHSALPIARPLTLLVVADKDQLLDPAAKPGQKRQVVPEFDLTGFVDDDGLDGDEAREAGGHQAVRGKHAQCAQDDPGAEQEPPVADEVVGELV